MPGGSEIAMSFAESEPNGRRSMSNPVAGLDPAVVPALWSSVRVGAIAAVALAAKAPVTTAANSAAIAVLVNIDASCYPWVIVENWCSAAAR